MTLKQLENEVLCLMFEEELDKASAFIAAANRAAAQIATERDFLTECVLYKKRTKPTEVVRELYHLENEKITLHLTCRALSFTACGKGKVLFTEEGVTRELEFDGEGVVVKEFIDTGSVKAEFLGEYSYDIRNLAAYSEIVSKNKEDIEVYSAFKEYDMQKQDPFFVSFKSAPLDEAGNEIKGAVLSGARLKLPQDYSGFFRIQYKRRASPITSADTECELDISKECEHLLPLLTAAYLLSDDNAELSAYYMSLYRDGMASVKLYNRASPIGSYNDVTGW